MSSTSSRRKANRVRSAGTPIGAIIAGACLVGLAKGLSAIAKAAFDQTIQLEPITNNPQLKSVAQIRAETRLKNQRTPVTGDLETIKGQVLADIASQPLWLANGAVLDAKVAALSQSSTLAGIEVAKNDLMKTLEVGQQKIFTTTLLNACHNAALEIGFKKIEARPSPLPSVFRLSAEDSIGRGFVIEVTAPLDRDVRIETEVVGVNDGSCNSILDAFDKALEDQGVRSQPPKRKYTGGVCETAAVRDFLADKAVREAKGPVQDEKFALNPGIRRAQRLNQKRPVVRNK